MQHIRLESVCFGGGTGRAEFTTETVSANRSPPEPNRNTCLGDVSVVTGEGLGCSRNHSGGETGSAGSVTENAGDSKTVDFFLKLILSFCVTNIWWIGCVYEAEKISQKSSSRLSP